MNKELSILVKRYIIIVHILYIYIYIHYILLQYIHYPHCEKSKLDTNSLITKPIIEHICFLAMIREI